MCNETHEIKLLDELILEWTSIITLAEHPGEQPAYMPSPSELQDSEVS